jgi:hypothetical protein
MSIITFVPHGKDWILTMNFEKQLPGSLTSPKIYNELSGKLLYAKDANVVGSWLILHEKGWVGAILPAAKFYRQEPGRNFHGLYKFLYEVMRSPEPLSVIKSTVLSASEPFVLILCLEHDLIEFYWNGQELTERSLSNQKAHYWESVYTSTGDLIALRSAKFFQQIENPSFELPELLLAIHKRFGEEKQVQANEYPVLKPNINACVTQIVIGENLLRMYYYDFLQPQYFTQTLVRHQEDNWW